MSAAKSRTFGLALMAASVILWSWSFDTSEQNATLRLSLAQTRSQTARLADIESPQAADIRHQHAALKDNEAQRWRSAAAGYGSDAQNLAAVLGRVKIWCVSSGMAECKVTKSSVTSASGPMLVPPAAGAASAPSAAVAFSPSSVRLTALFSPEATRQFLQFVAECACLFRLERFSVQQNRLEMDIIFFHSRDNTRAGSFLGTSVSTPVVRPSR